MRKIRDESEVRARAMCPSTFLCAIPVLVVSFWFRNYVMDDAMIYDRYIRNFLEGRGLVYNPGEYWNAITGPLFAWLSIGATFLTGDIHRATVLVSAVSWFLALVVFSRVFVRWSGCWFGFWAALLASVSSLFYATYGVETTMFLLLIGTCLYFLEKGWEGWLGVTCALLILVRGEGALLVAAIGIGYACEGRRFPRVRNLVAPAVLLSVWMVLNRMYYGAWLPETLMVRVWQGRSGVWGAWPAFLQVHEYAVYFHRSPLFFSVLAVFAVLGVERMGFATLNVVALSFLAMLSAFYLALNIPGYHWYLGPYFMFAAFYCGAGAAGVLRALMSFPGNRLRKGAVPVWRGAKMLLFLLAIVYLPVRALIGLVHFGPWLDCEDYRDVGQWLKANTPPDARIAVVEVGRVGWWSERHIVDILGVVTPRNARHIGEGRFSEWLREGKPDFVVAHVPLWSQEVGIPDAVEKGILVEDRRFRLSGYKLLVPGRDAGSGAAADPYSGN